MELQEHCKACVILHQTSFPHTSQKNRFPKQKHRHILDITLTLLFEMSVPHYLWSNGILTSTYLINCLPSSPLCSEIPPHRLHPNGDLFPLLPCVFGCVAFVQDHSPTKSKLAPQALKDMFVGYSRTHKGYCIYFLGNEKYVVYADVTFHKSLLYFNAFAPTPSLASTPLLLADPPLGHPPLKNCPSHVTFYSLIFYCPSFTPDPSLPIFYLYSFATPTFYSLVSIYSSSFYLIRRPLHFLVCKSGVFLLDSYQSSFTYCPM